MMTCPRCHESKAEDEFPPTYGTGVRPRARMCKGCKNKADYDKTARWVAANPEAALERYRRYEEQNNEARRQRYLHDPVYKAQNRKAAKRYRVANAESINKKQRDAKRAIRLAVLSIYGSKCNCCGDSHPEFLALDHVNGGGTAARKTETVNSLYARLAKIGVPVPEYRLLCHNCNMAFGFYGCCPHEGER